MLAGHGRQADPTLLLLLLAELAWFQAPSRLDLLAVARAPKLRDSLPPSLDGGGGSGGSSCASATALARRRWRQSRWRRQRVICI